MRRPDLFARAERNALFRLALNVKVGEEQYRGLNLHLPNVPTVEEFFDQLPEDIQDFLERYPELWERFMAGEVSVRDIIQISGVWQR